MSAIALYPVVRGLIYTALFALVGCRVAGTLASSTFRNDSEFERALRQRLWRVARATLTVLALLVALRGWLQLLTFLDPGDRISMSLADAVLFSGGWGRAWLLQLAAVVVLLVVTARREASTQGTTRDSVVIVLILWAQSGMGHAAGDNWHGIAGRLLDTAHLIGGGIWLGTLAVLAGAILPRLRDVERLPHVADLVRRFSICARIGVGLILLSGLTAAVVYAGSIAALIGSTWGRLLLIKVAAMTGVLALGWYNWRIMTPALEAGHVFAPQRLRRAIAAELLLGLAMLAITAVLVASPLPGEG